MLSAIYLYDNTETAVEIKQLGWNKSDSLSGETASSMKESSSRSVTMASSASTDTMTKVRVKGTDNYYLRPCRRFTQTVRICSSSRRMFIHGDNHSSITLKHYCEMMSDVFGDNAKVGVMYLFATLFRDIVTSYT